MDIDCKRLVSAYADWLKDRIKIQDVNGVCEITTPFLDRHNDKLQIYVQASDRGLRLTDDGYVINDLEMSGCSLGSPERQKLLRSLLNGFGVHEQDGELFIESSAEDFPRKKHALLQVMIGVNDMFLTATKKVVSLFHEDVEKFLEQHDVRFSPNVEFTGKSGYLHRFDFVIPKSRKKPERLLRVINNPTRNNATSLLFAWTDTKNVRPPNSQAFAVLNDQEKELKKDVLDAFDQYDVKTALWSRRDQFIAELVA